MCVKNILAARGGNDAERCSDAGRDGDGIVVHDVNGRLANLWRSMRGGS